MTTSSKCFFCTHTSALNGNPEGFEKVKDRVYSLAHYVTANRNANTSLLLCGKCQDLLEMFTRTHEALKDAQMKADSCVQEICNVMLEGNQLEKDLNNGGLRSDILEKAFLKIKKSQSLIKMASRIGDAGIPSTVVGSFQAQSYSTDEESKKGNGCKFPYFNCDKETSGLSASKSSNGNPEAMEHVPIKKREILPSYILRWSCVEKADLVETLYHCNVCNKKFLDLTLHLKKHGIIPKAASENASSSQAQSNTTLENSGRSETVVHSNEGTPNHSNSKRPHSDSEIVTDKAPSNAAATTAPIIVSVSGSSYEQIRQPLLPAKKRKLRLSSHNFNGGNA